MKFDKFNEMYNIGIDTKENYDSILKELEKNRSFERDNSLIIDFLFNEFIKYDEDLIKYRILNILSYLLHGRYDYNYFIQFKKFIFELLLSENEHIRQYTIHLIFDFRGFCLIRSSTEYKYYSNANYKFQGNELEEISKFRDLILDSYFELVELYNITKDEKIKKGLLKAIEQYYSPIMEEFIESTSKEKVDIYNKFSDLIWGKPRSFLEKDEVGVFQEEFIDKIKSQDDSIKYIKECQDIEDLRETTLELQEMIFDLNQEFEELEDENEELIETIRKLKIENNKLREGKK